VLSELNARLKKTGDITASCAELTFEHGIDWSQICKSTSLWCSTHFVRKLGSKQRFFGQKKPFSWRETSVESTLRQPDRLCRRHRAQAVLLLYSAFGKSLCT
jgi:hypothetical protein